MLLDSTLREGEQSFGTYMSLADKRFVLESLAYIGVEELEVGCIGQDDLADVYALAKRVAPAMMHTVWCRCTPDDVAAAAALGCTRVHIGVPVSEMHRSLRLDCTHSALLERLSATMAAAREHGVRMLSVGLEDASRASRDTLLAVARYACELGASRLRLSDTVGLWTPEAIRSLVRAVGESVRIPVGVHCHNDLGMATANSVAALESGAAFADCSVLGIGERAGITKLEELAAAVNVLSLKGADHAYRLTGLRELCSCVGKTAKVDVARNAPVVGTDIFAVESGLHAHGVHRCPSLFEPFSPQMAGHLRSVHVGKKSGRAAVAEKALELNVPIVEKSFSGLVKRIRRTSQELARPLTDHEFVALCSEHCG